MVVVSGSWGMKNVSVPIQMNREIVIATITNTMTAKAVLISRPNSHLFQNRTLPLDRPVKVGRSVARARATPTNAIFDCKVLSRHHALLWYDSGKFFLQDTKSSNGTFVNNNRLAATDSDPHEVSSGDIVQFGVDVVENNRKVTHGCIIATLKLYLPDGTEAKASPSITEADRHGVVPLVELYKLNQIIQEASQREECLEIKLTALQHVVEAARQAANESWQAYVGEERLLSRVSTLETQLMQANKGFGDDRLKEELNKLQIDRTEYQVAAKLALEKLHAERLEALASAAKQQRARATAEDEAVLAKEQLESAQQELQDIAQKLAEEQKKADEERSQLDQNETKLQALLLEEGERVSDLQNKLEQMRSLALHPGNETLPLEALEKYNLIYNDDFKIKEELIAENDNNGEGDCNRSSNGLQEPNQNLINIKSEFVEDRDDLQTSESNENSETDSQDEDEVEDWGSNTIQREHTNKCETVPETENKDELNSNKEDISETQSSDESEETVIEKQDIENQNGTKENELTTKDFYSSESFDTKTLKYQYQTAQIELKRQIEQLEIISTANKTRIALLEKSLMNEKEEKLYVTSKYESLKEELSILETKWMDSLKVTKDLREKVDVLQGKLQEAQTLLENEVTKEVSTSEKASQITQKDQVTQLNIDISTTNQVSIEDLTAVEEELVALKERYAQLNDEKLVLNRELVAMHEQYNRMRDSKNNTLFFYIAPLVLMVLYLLISSMFS